MLGDGEIDGAMLSVDDHEIETGTAEDLDEGRRRNLQECAHHEFTLPKALAQWWLGCRRWIDQEGVWHDQLLA